MKTFVIAQHHGTFVTLQSLIDQNIKDIVVLIPGSQVEKYNKMYQENSSNDEFAVFKEYDKLINNFVKEKDPTIEVYVVDDFDVRNTVVSTLKAIQATGYNQVAACILSGTLANADYTDIAKMSLAGKEFGACMIRVYQTHPYLSMYHMIGYPQQDKSIDINFFIVDMSKVNNNYLNDDKVYINTIIKEKKLQYVGRELNGKHDILIGTAISARQTVVHNLHIRSGYIVNLWNKCITQPQKLASEEFFGYPMDLYSNCARSIGSKWFPLSTYSRILENGDETYKCTSGLYECMDIIDL